MNKTIFLPVGDGKDSFIDPRDIAACAVKLLTTPAHNGRIYEVTGTEHLTYTEVVEKLSAAVGTQISFQDVPKDAARQGMLASGLPTSVVDSFDAFFGLVKNGRIYSMTTEVAELLGRPARTFDEWVRDRAAALS